MVTNVTKCTYLQAFTVQEKVNIGEVDKEKGTSSSHKLLSPEIMRQMLKKK